MSQDIKFFSHNKGLDWNKGIFNNLIANDEGIRILSKKKYRVLENIEIDSYQGDKVEDLILKSKNYIYMYMKDRTLWKYDVTSTVLEFFMDLGHEDKNIGLEVGNDTLYTMEYGGSSIIKAYSTISKEKLWELDSIDARNFYPIKMSVDQYNYLYFMFIYEEDMKNEDKFLIYTIQIDPRGRVRRIYDTPLEVQKIYSIHSLHNRFFMDLFQQQIIIFDKDANKLYKIKEKKEIEKIESFLDKRYICSGMSVDAYGQIIMAIEEKDQGKYLVSLEEDGSMEIYSKISGKDLRKLAKDLEGYLLCPDFNSGHIRIFAMRTEHEFNKFTGNFEGTFLSSTLDGEEKGIRWHRLCIDAEIPEDTYIKVSVFSRDTKEIYIKNEKIDIDEYIQSTTINFQEKEEFLQPFWDEEFINQKDVLLHKHRGRYLWYKIRFIGNQEHTPSMNKIRIYYPMVSFIQYLPEIYQMDPKNSDFLIRFLGIFQTMMLDLETQIDNISEIFDPKIVDQELLYWLSSWLGIEDVYLWEENSLRDLMKNAMYIYKKKGTKESIEKIVELYTGQRPYIVENHILNKLRDTGISRQHLEELYGNSVYMFTIIIKEENISESKYKALKKIIENIKPAYTEVNIVVLKPFLYLDHHTYLGINSILSQRMPLRLNTYSTVPISTVLAE